MNPIAYQQIKHNQEVQGALLRAISKQLDEVLDLLRKGGGDAGITSKPSSNSGNPMGAGTADPSNVKQAAKLTKEI